MKFAQYESVCYRFVLDISKIYTRTNGYNVVYDVSIDDNGAEISVDGGDLVNVVATLERSEALDYIRELRKHKQLVKIVRTTNRQQLRQDRPNSSYKWSVYTIKEFN